MSYANADQTAVAINKWELHAILKFYSEEMAKIGQRIICNSWDLSEKNDATEIATRIAELVNIASHWEDLIKFSQHNPCVDILNITGDIINNERRNTGCDYKTSK